MKIDEEKVIKSFRDYLNNSINSLSFYRESKEVVIDKFKIEGTIDVSNVNVVCPTCGKATRVKHAVVSGKKVRVCSCGAVLDKKYVKDSKVKAEKKSAENAEEPKKTATKAATEKKSKVTSKATNEKATKTAEAKKPTTARSSQRGV